jgi:site-specific recombinase XerD
MPLAPIPPCNKPPARLSVEEFYGLRDVPPETEWFANIDNPNTRRAYRNDIRDFMTFTGLTGSEQLRSVVRTHVIAWREHLVQRECSRATIRRKLAALSSLYGYLAENNSILLSPVDGVKRPKAESEEGKTPALSDADARALLAGAKAGNVTGKTGLRHPVHAALPRPSPG